MYQVHSATTTRHTPATQSDLATDTSPNLPNLLIVSSYRFFAAFGFPAVGATSVAVSLPQRSEEVLLVVSGAADDYTLVPAGIVTPLATMMIPLRM